MRTTKNDWLREKHPINLYMSNMTYEQLEYLMENYSEYCEKKDIYCPIKISKSEIVSQAILKMFKEVKKEMGE